MSRTAVDQLARSTEADLVDARQQRASLIAAARLLALSAGHDPDIARCDDAGCRLAATDPNGRLCDVTHRLARLAPGSVANGPVEVRFGSFLDALGGFLDALDGSFEAVRACRQTAHASGYCWFSAEPGGDGCAQVLRLAHRLS